MCADKTEFSDGVLEFPNAVHAHERIDSDQAREMFRIGFDRVGDDARRHVIAARQTGAAGLRGDKKTVFDSRRAHPLDHFLECQA